MYVFIYKIWALGSDFPHFPVVKFQAPFENVAKQQQWHKINKQNSNMTDNTVNDKNGKELSSDDRLTAFAVVC